MNQPQATHDPFTEGIIPQFGNHHPFFVTNNNVLNITGTVDQNGNLTTQIGGKLDKAGRQFVTAKLVNRYPPPVEAFQ